MMRFIVGFIVCLLCCSVNTYAQAREKRLALLVGNERGWKKDPRLRYALKGDLFPLARQLRKIGFEVKVLANQSAGTLRETLRKMAKKLGQKSVYRTFLFYYSGHADKRYFHLNKRGRRPLSYDEFVKFFSKLRVSRRIAIFDACYSGAIIRRFGSLRQYRALREEGIAKGVRARHRINLREWLLPQQGEEQGVRLISSSLDVSWEMRRYRASVFTHYLLKGLKGEADLNKNGQISFDELFDYASKEVSQITGQRPQQMLLLKRAQPYALAPAYNSRLWIAPDIYGTVRVQVGNFAWRQEKKKGEVVRLLVVRGKGVVSLQRGRQCWKQKVDFRYDRETRLSGRWETMSCLDTKRSKKGVLVLSAQAAQQDVPHVFGLYGGVMRVGDKITSMSSWATGLSWRYDWLGVSVSFSRGPAEVGAFQYTRFDVQIHLGWPYSFFTFGHLFRFFVGGFGRIGLTLQEKPRVSSVAITSWAGGGVMDLSWWPLRYVGCRLGGELGLDQTPTVSGDGFSLALKARFSILWHF